MRIVPVLVDLMVLAGSVTPATLLSQQAESPNLRAPTVTSAADGILAAFQTHPLVGLGDEHGMAQEADFYIALIRDKRFASEVGNVVVEFGDAVQQETIDRYVSGEDVPYEQLRTVWADTVGWIPTVSYLGYMNFYAQVRAVNLSLPPEQRIHVWLGDPPVDWSKVKVKADLPHFVSRDRSAADVIDSQILAKRKKALVIYGGSHFFGKNLQKQLVEERYPGAFFVVSPYTGFIDKSCSEAFEQTLHDWPKPALATPVRRSTLQAQMRSPNCHFVEASDLSYGPGTTEAEKAKDFADMEDKVSGVDSDAMLYLGPAASLTESPISPDLYLDADFRKEINRRLVLMGRQPNTWPTVMDNPMSPRYIHSYGGLENAQPK
jgi:hypothetical protein